ncbi:ABC transporter substrate-binding protein [Rhodopila sp.]|uniref:ABC transporter substrate-binding protein n=1 Tax=Rhodopila sp. TaxID=2480087 RepID=UPI003D0C998F
MASFSISRQDISRRSVLVAGATSALISIDPRQACAAQPLEMQLGWLGGGNQLGEVAALRLGYFAEEGLDLKILPGGPNNDGVAAVASGHSAVGQVSSSPSLMLAVSQDLPVRCFAVSAQKHPYAFFSLAKNPVHTPADLKGKKVGIQATGVVLLRALLAKNGMDLKDVKVVTIGSDMMPIMTGQVDVVTGWLTNTTALKVLGPDRVTLRLWDAGVQLYADPYYATPDTIANQGDVLARFLRASARGWGFAHTNRDKAVELLVKQYPNLVPADERAAADVMLDYCFDEHTRAGGYGTMDPAVWHDQIALYASLNQFTKRTPKLDEVMTLDILKATAAARPRIG